MRVILAVALLGFFMFMVVGVYVFYRTESKNRDRSQDRVEHHLQKGREFEAAGNVRDALLNYSQARLILRERLREVDPALEGRIRELHACEWGKNSFESFVSRLSAAKAADLGDLLREGRRLQEEHALANPPWGAELEKILARLEQIERKSE